MSPGASGYQSAYVVSQSSEFGTLTMYKESIPVADTHNLGFLIVIVNGLKPSTNHALHMQMPPAAAVATTNRQTNTLMHIFHVSNDAFSSRLLKRL